MKVFVFVCALIGVMSCMTGCKTYVPVPTPTPCCRNPWHDHYQASPVLLWTEKVTTDTHTHQVEERFWSPLK